jgi:hypothetical protein
MIGLYVFAALLLLIGGVIVTLHAFRHPSPFTCLIERGIDPHLWGFNLLGTGFMLSLVLMMVQQVPWSQEGLAGRVVVSGAMAWMVAALAMSVAALFAQPRSGSSLSLFPAPDAKLTAWPSSYRVFVALGFAAIGVLGVMLF